MQKWPQQNRIVLRNVTPFVWQVDCLGIVNVIICHNVCGLPERDREEGGEGKKSRKDSRTAGCPNVDADDVAHVHVEMSMPLSMSKGCSARVCVCVCGFNLVAKLTMRHDNTPSTWTASS